ncbi:hypothetical protein FK530_00175 [Tsukamurella conjunctivitidis]|uniref:Uncharacterized protein n=3 Tax=Tsukamurellaceae TaxID=85028 RepID=A0A5C5S683_9ACTN|nr:hypothetical protein [Tsukamurella columbiensis]TWS30986.1 hypothetical protein FK530_00175 [Tsukamurella conjunctivitidis]
MAEAVARHRRDLAAGEPMLTHRFLCPAARIDELRAALTGSDRITLGLIGSGTALSAAAAVVEADPRLRIALVEFAADPGRLGAEVRAASTCGAAVFVEPVERADTPRLATALTGLGAGLKIRCGGVRAEMFPSPTHVAEALLVAAAAGVPVKATAGLHHAVRHRDPRTGFVHHGFLNLVVGAARAALDGGRDDVAEALSITDGAALAAEAAELAPESVTTTRRLLASYGSCNTAVPPAETAALGLAPVAPEREGHRS